MKRDIFIGVISGLIVLMTQFILESMGKLLEFLGISITNNEKNCIALFIILFMWVVLTTLIARIGNAYKNIIISVIKKNKGNMDFVKNYIWVLNIGAIILSIGLLLLYYNIVDGYLFKIATSYGINLFILIGSISYCAIGGLVILIISIRENLGIIELIKKYKFIGYYYISEYIILFIYLVYMLIKM